ncbi:MAG: M15 family metallopeptidase [Candidatus Choladocola sp.]|nr:M15 family metallopeptidase [Candidatus Choladocola sp.]
MKWVNRILATFVIVLLILCSVFLGILLYRGQEQLAELSDHCSRLESELGDMKDQVEQLSGEVAQIRESEAAAAMTEAEPQIQQETEIKQDPAVPMISDEDAEKTEAGTLIQTERLSETDLDAYFRIYPISDEIFSRIYGKSYKEYCTVPREDLRYLKVLHYDFDHQVRVGELIVSHLIAEDCLEIFRQLYRSEYEIQSMYLIDNYGADDFTSIEANNTSAFNYRNVTGSSNLSNHALGLAIDINPQQNPYVEGNGTYYHPNAADYVDRSRTDVGHMINHDDLCYQLFTEHGFTWGGDWSSLKDYQHFEKQVS